MSDSSALSQRRSKGSWERNLAVGAEGDSQGEVTTETRKRVSLVFPFGVIEPNPTDSESTDANGK